MLFVPAAKRLEQCNGRSCYSENVSLRTIRAIKRDGVFLQCGNRIFQSRFHIRRAEIQYCDTFHFSHVRQLSIEIFGLYLCNIILSHEGKKYLLQKYTGIVYNWQVASTSIMTVIGSGGYHINSNPSDCRCSLKGKMRDGNKKYTKTPLIQCLLFQTLLIFCRTCHFRIGTLVTPQVTYPRTAADVNKYKLRPHVRPRLKTYRMPDSVKKMNVLQHVW